MLSISYNSLQFSLVENINEFFKEKLVEIPKIKSMYQTIKVLLSVVTENIKILVAEGSRVYKIVVSSGTRRGIICWFVYIPEQRRIDLYDPGYNTDIPFIQWRDKKVVYSGCSNLLQDIGIEKLFRNIIIAG